MTGRVLVLGNAGLDLAITVPRLPRAGETLVGGAFRRAPGGKGLNQAVMAARAGAAVAFCAPLGADPEGRFVEAALRREPIAALELPRPGPPTDLSVIAVARDGENCILSSGACADALPPERAGAFAAAARPADVLLLQGNLSRSATESAARIAAARGARVLLNTAPLRWPIADLLASCWGVVANEVEAEQIAGGEAAAASEALARLGPAVVVVTLAARGCLANGVLHPPPKTEAVDSTGAGDAFCGTLAAALVQGLPFATAIMEAQRAAAETVTRPGAFDALPSRFTLRN